MEPGRGLVLSARAWIVQHTHVTLLHTQGGVERRAQCTVAAGGKDVDLPDGKFYGGRARAGAQGAGPLDNSANARVLRRSGCGAAGTWQMLGGS